MALNRMETVVQTISSQINPNNSAAIDKAWIRSLKAVNLESTSRLGKAGGLSPGMGKITPNQITAFFELAQKFWKDSEQIRNAAE